MAIYSLVKVLQNRHYTISPYSIIISKIFLNVTFLKHCFGTNLHPMLNSIASYIDSGDRQAGVYC